MFGFLADLVSSAITTIDENLQDTPASQLIFGTALLYFLYNQYQNPWILRAYRSRNSVSMKQRIIDTAYDLAKNLPGVRARVEKELDKNLESTKEKIKAQRSEMNLQEEMPQEGVSPEQILKEFEIDSQERAYRFDRLDNKHPDKQFILKKGDGKDSGALYTTHPRELVELLKETYGSTELTNPMHDKWPRINAMQAEIISWCQNLFHGSKKGYGLLTHGGTTSIIEAMAAYVIQARARGIAHPEIVVPETAHAAFKKAAALTGATLIVVPVDKKTGAVDPDVMASYISRNTAVMVGSAPSFMNGINDPISKLGQLARKKNVPFHVDACLGGFLTAFLDTSTDPMDFRVPGVTSISADMHKYGYCPKGTSVCLFSEDSPALSVYAALNWSGGLYATPGILDGSTSGARVAEVYTTLSYYGRKRYQEIAQNIIQLRESIQSHFNEQLVKYGALSKKDISVYGDPKWSVLGFRSDTLNSHLIADELEKKGWKLNLLQNPDGFHICLTHVHTLMPNFKEQFVEDLLEAVSIVKTFPKNKKPSGNMKVYGTIGVLPTAIQSEICEQYQKTRLDLNLQAPREVSLFPISSKNTKEESLRHRETEQYTK